MGALETITINQLEPQLFPGDARKVAVSKFGNSLTLASGTLLAVKTSDGKLYAYAEGNDVQTVTVAGTLSAGSFRIQAVDSSGVLQTTDAIAYNANAATVQTAVNAVLGANAVGVAGTSISSMTFTFSGTGYAGIRQPLIVVGPTLPTGATSYYVSHAAATGLETAVGILGTDIATDGSGNMFLGNVTTATSLNPPVNSTHMFVAGTFNTSDLTGYDAGALADLGGRTLANGYIRIP
jgi:hypothetical protein